MWRARFLSSIVIALMVTALFAGTVSAKKGPPGTIAAEEEEGSNNLSVPAIYVGSIGVGSPLCTVGDDSLDPAGQKGVLLPDGITVDHAEYYVQGVATWQADCDLVTGPVTATADWGDNLTGAPLKQGTPIRTEIGFLADVSLVDAMPGYEVVKLDPDLLDRESHYGTLGVEVPDYPEVRVWSPATLTIQLIDPATGLPIGTPFYAGTFTAELNSTGRVVYGYNWLDPAGGTYLLTVSASGVNLTGTDVGTVVSPTTVQLTVTVADKAGGGGGGGGGGNGGGGGGWGQH